MEKNWIDCTIYNHVSIGELINQFYIEFTDEFPVIDEVDRETKNIVTVIAVEVYKYLQHECFIDSRGYVK
jgi:hypothetical protein